jgi:hypothetical protein
MRARTPRRTVQGDAGMHRAAALVFALAAPALLVMGCQGSAGPAHQPGSLSCEVAPSDSPCVACLKMSCCAEARVAETSLMGPADSRVTHCGVEHCSAQCRWKARE